MPRSLAMACDKVPVDTTDDFLVDDTPGTCVAQAAWNMQCWKRRLWWAPASRAEAR